MAATRCYQAPLRKFVVGWKVAAVTMLPPNKAKAEAKAAAKAAAKADSKKDEADSLLSSDFNLKNIGYNSCDNAML